MAQAPERHESTAAAEEGGRVEEGSRGTTPGVRARHTAAAAAAAAAAAGAAGGGRRAGGAGGFAAGSRKRSEASWGLG
eukprot:146055-Hanusia_phi.AAC.1